MIDERCRERLNYTAISLFVAWHTIGMVIGPSPDSVITRSFRAVWGNYLTYFKLDSSWTFFAPEIGLQSQFRYIIKDVDGKEHAFELAITPNQFHPKYRWFKLI